MSMFRSDDERDRRPSVGRPPWKGARAPRSCVIDELRTELADLLAQLLAEQVREVDRRFLHGLMDVLDSPTLGLPHFPDTPLLLDEVLREVEPRQADILRIVERDPELVRAIWARASGPRFGSAPNDLGQAVTRVGLDEVWRIGVQGALRSLRFEVPDFQVEVTDIRRRAPVGATVTAWLARQSRGEPYLAGLLRDVGALLIHNGTHALSRSDRVRPELVQEVTGATHAIWSALAVGVWGLAPGVAVAVGHHHVPQACPSELRQLAELVHAGDIAAYVAVGAAGATWQAASAALDDLVAPSRDAASILKMAGVALQTLGG